MIVFRLTKGTYKNDLSGKGAELAGGRWNSKGLPMLYTSSSRALCMAEVAVHLPLHLIPVDYWLVSIELPGDAEAFEIQFESLPGDWDTFPHSASTQKIGDQFLLAGDKIIFKAPSAVVKGDFNLLFNPRHPEFGTVKIIESEPFEFDSRLFAR
ncbi:MAG: RES family NAD+ phosphorylase [Saprospiraceae bacterium]|nr:RES family NAD+ phosphorylase [Saprospiraceae bacterium]